MRRATGRDPDDVRIAARCLLAGAVDPSPEEVARAHLIAFGLLDLHRLSRGISG